MSSTLYDALCRLFSSLQVYQQKLHGFHWHVTGVEFYQMHLLFDRLYGMLSDFEDRLAEHIRGYGKTPVRYSEYIQLSSVQEEDVTVEIGYMLATAVQDLASIRKDLSVANELAIQAKRYGTQNLLGELDEVFDTMFYLLASNKKGFNI